MPDGRYYNAARLLARGASRARPYRKVHLVPFGEYVPLPRVFFFVRQISTEIGAFTPAAAADRCSARGRSRSASAICYETIYPSLARREAADGANLLATISNDSWYGRAGAQEQHFAGAVLRAVENDRYLLRAAITGISGIVDARGRILAETPARRAGARSRRRAARDGRDRLDPLGLPAPGGRRRRRRRRANLRPRPLGRAPLDGSRTRPEHHHDRTRRSLSALDAASERLTALRGYL